MGDHMRSNNGDSWCVDLYLFETTAMAQGCENVHIRCDATDLDFIYDPVAAREAYSKVQKWSIPGNRIRTRTGATRSFSIESLRIQQTKECLKELCPRPKSSGKVVVRSSAFETHSVEGQAATWHSPLMRQRNPSGPIASQAATRSQMIRLGDRSVGLEGWTSYGVRLPCLVNGWASKRHNSWHLTSRL